MELISVENVASIFFLALVIFAVGLLFGALTGNRNLREQNELLRRRLYEVENYYGSSTTEGSGIAIFGVLLFLGLFLLYLLN